MKLSSKFLLYFSNIWDDSKGRWYFFLTSVKFYLFICCKVNTSAGDAHVWWWGTIGWSRSPVFCAYEKEACWWICTFQFPAPIFMRINELWFISEHERRVLLHFELLLTRLSFVFPSSNIYFQCVFFLALFSHLFLSLPKYFPVFLMYFLFVKFVSLFILSYILHKIRYLSIPEINRSVFLFTYSTKHNSSSHPFFFTSRLKYFVSV